MGSVGTWISLEIKNIKTDETVGFFRALFARFLDSSIGFTLIFCMLRTLSKI